MSGIHKEKIDHSLPGLLHKRFQKARFEGFLGFNICLGRNLLDFPTANLVLL